MLRLVSIRKPSMAPGKNHGHGLFSSSAFRIKYNTNTVKEVIRLSLKIRAS